MTQKTKLEIIDEYRKDHPGPFCTRDGRPVRVLCSDMKNEFSIVAIVLNEDGKETVSTFINNGNFFRSGVDEDRDLMCAREVPVAREFWLVEFNREIDRFCVTDTEQAARCILGNSDGALRIVRTLEVLPGEAA